MRTHTIELTDAQIYYLNEIMLHEYYRLKESPNRDILLPFLDRIDLPTIEPMTWKEMLEIAKEENERLG